MVDKIVILDYGSQYTQLIARRVRECQVYSEIQPYHHPINWKDNIKGVILSGSPWSVHDHVIKDIDIEDIASKVPVLGICFGAQWIIHRLGGTVSRSEKREYGPATLRVLDQSNPLLAGLPQHSQVWMSHADTIERVPDRVRVIAETEDIPIAAYEVDTTLWGNPVWGVQFHPEVSHTSHGMHIFRRFVLDICQCRGDWTPASFIESTIEQLRQQLGRDHAIIAMSGGVDSTVAGVLVHRAIGSRMHGIFIDNGLLRKGEFEQVLNAYRSLGLNVHGVDAREEFYSGLKGVVDPEQKRKIIGKTFIEVFERWAKKLSDVRWLVQGTIYPDVIESVSVHGPSVTIKSHHNVGGLPERMHLRIVEPLRMLFKDEVRKVGRALGIPDHILNRHPFPGPGLAIRIIGEVTPQHVRLLQQADEIYIRMLKQSGWYDKIWQAGAILLPIKTVGVMGDERSYERVIALRAVNSRDGMTAQWTPLPHELLAQISSTIINQVPGINRVVYDISTKPPSTIEWE